MRSASQATSWPSTRAEPPASGSRPHRARMSVVLPEPLGPSRPNTSPVPTARLTRSTAANLPKRTVTSRRSITSGPVVGRCIPTIPSFPFSRACRVCRASLRQGHGDVRCHAGLEDAVRVGDADLDAKDLMAAFVGTLHIPRRELALGGDLHHGAVKTPAGVAVDADFDRLAEVYPAEVRFRDVDLDPEVVGPEDAQDRLVGRHQVALAH